MINERMKCPFSGKSCAQCPLFRGRHYFRWHKEGYSEYLKEKQEAYKGSSRAYFQKV